VTGLFNYRGRPVPAVDLSELTLGRPSAERLSTRIMVVRCPDRRGTSGWLGLIAEHATEMVRKEPAEFVEAGGSRASEICLGPVLMDAQGSIQRIDERRLISESLLALLFPETAEAAGGEA
jgi:chemotaxis-related protein WspB